MPTVLLLLASSYTFPNDCGKLYDDIRIVTFAEQDVVQSQKRKELNALYAEYCNE